MNTAYLENFIAIAEERNISAAARRMHIAQSALSTQLKSLEEEMGCMLLKRSSHGVSLSFEGEMFYRYARRMLALERELRDQLDDCADGNAGILKLGVSSACLAWVLDGPLHRFGRKFPRVKYEIYEKSGTEVLTALRDRTVDVGVIKALASPMEDMRVHYKNSESMAVLYESRADYFDGGNISFAQLNGVPLCITRKTLSAIMHACAASGFEPEVSVLCEQFETAANMALRGRGAAVVPLAMAERYARGTYYEDKRSYFHAAKARVYKLNGERVHPNICDATNNADECSVVLPKGFDGYLLYPLDVQATVPLRNRMDTRTSIQNMENVNRIVFDFRYQQVEKGQQYAIGGIYMVNDISELPNGAFVLDDFSDVYRLADDYRVADLSSYRQSISMISSGRVSELEKALILTVPNSEQYVDALHCCSNWMNVRFLPNIHNYKYFAVRIINMDIKELCVSVMLLELPRLAIARLDEKVLDTAVTVVTYSDCPLSAPAAEFIKEFTP